MKIRGSGVIKQILMDHFDGFWTMHARLFPESYREDIKQTVKKQLDVGHQELGMPSMNVWGVKETRSQSLSLLHAKVDFAVSVEKSTQMSDRINTRS